MRRLLKFEEPDLVVFGGDQISDYYGDAPYPKPLKWATEKWEMALSPMFENGRRTPFATIMGNHDYGVDATADILLGFDSGHSGSLSRPSNDTAYFLEVRDMEGSDAITRLYMFNSGPAGMYQRHEDWYRSTSTRLKRSKNLESRPTPAIAFIHIPLKEFMYAYNAGAYRGTMGDRDGICCHKTDHKVFEAFVELDEVKVVVSGHDHGNNFVGEWQGIQLAYGLKTGDGGYPIDEKKGARVFQLSMSSSINDSTQQEVMGSILYSETISRENRTLTIHSWLRYENGDFDAQDTISLEPPTYALEGCCISPPKETPWAFIITTTITAVMVCLALALLVRSYFSYKRTSSTSTLLEFYNATEMEELVVIGAGGVSEEVLHHED